MKRITSLCALLLCTAFLTGCAGGESTIPEPESAAELSVETEPSATEPAVTEPPEQAEILDGEKEGWLSCTYAGIRHDMILDLPETSGGGL